LTANQADKRRSLAVPRRGSSMSRFTHTVLAGCMLMLAVPTGTVAAEQIYRSVDAEGNVTFSSQPPTGAVAVDKVNVQPGPSDAEQSAARERVQRQEATASEMSEARANRVQQQPAGTPVAPEVVVPEEPLNQYYGYPYGNTPRRDQLPERLPGRPVNLPARPVQPPARPVQLPARPVPR
jgi:hypothetical protein